MCPPVAIAAAAGAAKVTSSVFGGIAARNAANANAQIADQNAEYANSQAADAIWRGSQSVSQRYLQAGQLEGQQTAAMAANGVDLGFGSPLAVVGDTALTAGMDAANLRLNAGRESQGYRLQAVNYRNQAASDRSQGQAAFISGLLGGVSDALSTASQIKPIPTGK